MGWEDPMEKEMATHSSTLSWKSHGQKSLVGYSPWGRKESDTTERLHFTNLPWSDCKILCSLSLVDYNEHPGLISFRMDWLDLLAIQRTLKSLLQHHSSKESILQRSAFFTVQLSHLYMTTGKTIALTRQTFVGIVMSLLFNMLSRLIITFLPRSKVKVKESHSVVSDSLRPHGL